MLDRVPQTIPESVTSIPLPPLPQVLVRFLALVEDERTPLTDLATLVALDPAFTAQLLTVATSPPYRRETPLITLEQSLAPLGRPLLRSLASCMAVRHPHAQTGYGRNFDHPGFWRHSLRVAALARSLADAVGYEDVEEAYLAGLLHDIGQLLLVGGVGELCGILPGDSAPETGFAGSTQIPGGIDHALVGASLIDSWRLSSFMADAVLFHRFPAEQISSAELLCRIVWSAHRLGASAGEADEILDFSPDITAIPAILGIDQATIVKACRPPLEWVEERALFLGVRISRGETAHPDSGFIYPDLSLPKRHVGDAGRTHLEALVGNLAVMQPLQESLIALTDEADLYGALRETARLLFGLQRPVFLLQQPESHLLVAVAGAGQPPLLTRLQISLDPGRSLAALAFRTQQPCSSFTDEDKPAPSLFDIQLARLLGSQGLLCIPMSNGSQQVGVIVFGVSGEQYAGKRTQLEWMTGFARLAARSLEQFRALREREQRIAADLTRQFEQKTRKVIHEAVNPLGIINNYLKILAEKLGDTPEVQQELTILGEEISRVERIVRGLNDLPVQSLPVETVNVNNLIEGMLALYGESLFETRGIDIDTELAPGLPLAKADRDSLKQILFNLWKNSSEAMPAGGSFRISTSAMAQGDGCRTLEIRLSDSGPGIPPDVMESLFQPRAPDRSPASSGVGLSIVASLVDRLGGEISCDSSPGQGTTFTIRLAHA